MKERKWSLTASRNTERDAYIWNLLSICFNSFQTIFLLFIMTRFGNEKDSSILVMAYAVANLLVYIGKYGIRQYQVTDAEGKYRYGEYVRARVISVALMAAAAVLYILWGCTRNGYSPEKAAVIGLLVVYKGTEAAEDVIHGRFQQMGRLDVAAKIWTIRLFVFILGFTLTYIFTKSLILTAAVNTGIALFLALVLNKSARGELPGFGGEGNAENGKVKNLLWETLPLCLTAISLMYLGNAPKYVIDGIVSDEIQTAFNIVMMPAFVVSLMSNFIYNPSMRKIGELWAEGRLEELNRLILRLLLVPLVIDLAALLLGYWKGTEALGLIYGVELASYRGILMIFLLTSGILAVMNLLIILITTVRRQRYGLYAFAAGSLLMLFAGRPVLREYGLTRLCVLYLIVLAAIALYCGAVYVFAYRKQRRNPAGAGESLKGV